MKEENIQQLLVGELKPVSVRVPLPLFEKLMKMGREKYGARRERGLVTEALLYFAARGLLDWEEKNNPQEQEKSTAENPMDRLRHPQALPSKEGTAKRARQEKA